LAAALACPSCRRSYPAGSLARPACPACGGPLAARRDSSRLQASWAGDSDLAPTPAPRPGPGAIGPYALLRPLGQGSFGAVYLARRPGGPEVALKVLLHVDPTEVQRFRREAEVVQRVAHPGVVPVLDFGQHGRHPYYVMEYCRGETLRDRLRRGPLAVADAVRLVRDLADAVAAVHAAGVVHRDLKPANVILEAGTGRPRLTDFGLASDRRVRALTRTGDALGTPVYMAPEQFTDAKRADRRADVYGLGVLLYECVAGRRPFEARRIVDVARLVREVEPPPLRTLRPEAPPAVAEVCRRAMAKDPAERPPDAAAFARELEAALAAGRAGGRRPAPLAAAAAAAIVLAGAAVAGLLATRGGAAAEGEAAAAEGEPAATAAASPTAGGAPPADAAPPASPAPADGAPADGAPADGAPPSPPRAAGAPTEAFEAALAAARAADARLEPLDAVRARLAEARELAGPDAERRAAVGLATVEVLRGRGRHRDVVDVAEGLGLDPTGPAGLRARFHRAAALQQLGDDAAFRAEAEALAADDPRGAVGLLAASYLGFARRQGHDPRLIRKAAARDPAFVSARVLEGYVLQSEGRLEEALRLVEAEVLPRQPNRQDALWLAVNLNQQLRRIEAAIPHLDRMIALSEPSPPFEVLYQRARMDLHAGRLEAVRARLDRALEVEPGALIGHLMRGVVAYQLGDAAAADADWKAASLAGLAPFERELERRYRQRETQRLIWSRVLAVHRLEPSPPGPALRALLAARAAAVPEPARAAVLEALVALAGGAPWADAADAWARARAAAPDSLPLLLEHAAALLGRARPEEALAALAEARALGPSGAAALRLERLSADAAARADDPERAERAWRALAARDPDGAAGRHARAALAQQGGDFAAALEELDAALAADPDHVPSLLSRASLRAVEDRRPLLALADVERARALEGLLDVRLAVAHAKARALLLDVLGRAADAPGELEPLLAIADGPWLRCALASIGVRVDDPALLAWCLEAAEETAARHPDLAAAHLVAGALALRAGRPPDDVLARWTRAREADPDAAVPPTWLEAFRERHGERPEVEALAPPR